MVEEQLRARGIRDPRVLAAMGKLLREEFIASEDFRDAYGDHPLPIGAGQTVSQPYIVAAMVEALELQPGDRVLEVGTGTGYEAAILAELAAEVWTIERHEELAGKAREILARLGYANVHVVHGDGHCRPVDCGQHNHRGHVVLLPETFDEEDRAGGRCGLDRDRSR